LRPNIVLNEMNRVLRPGGMALISFDGVWSCSYGHHLLQFGSIRNLVPAWAHLFLSQEQFANLLSKREWPPDATITAMEAAEYVYQSDELNRLSIAELRQFFDKSPLEIVWIDPYLDELVEERKPIAQYLSNFLPWNPEELLTRGMSLLLRKKTK
jgi:SAM-dependent methyltransferase